MGHVWLHSLQNHLHFYMMLNLTFFFRYFLLYLLSVFFLPFCVKFLNIIHSFQAYLPFLNVSFKPSLGEDKCLNNLKDCKYSTQLLKLAVGVHKYYITAENSS